MYANSLIVAVAYALGDTELVLTCRKYSSAYTVIAIVLIFTFVNVDLIILYVVMLYKYWKHKYQRQQLSATSMNKDTHGTDGIMQIFFVLTFYFGISWAPFTVSAFYSQLSSSLTAYKLIFYSGLLGSTNSCVNAFVYAVKNKDFHEAFRCILRGDLKMKRISSGTRAVYSLTESQQPDEGQKYF